MHQTALSGRRRRRGAESGADKRQEEDTMRITYRTDGGKTMGVGLSQVPLTIGRSNDAGITALDPKVSNLHCEIRFWGGDYVIKDLHSRNGTYVNGKLIQVAQLSPGDSIRCGHEVFTVTGPKSKGSSTIIREIQEEMAAEGKGFETELHEIVEDALRGTEALVRASGRL